MTDSKHAELVRSLAKSGKEVLADLRPNDAHLLHMILGITGEVGELVDALKKHLIYGSHLNYGNIVEELGDIEFYLEGLRQGLGIPREDTIKWNIHKLQKRYGSTYSNDAAIARVDKEGS